ncbi:PHP domain-containing protein [Haloactinopolyspora sp.]|uniref:PHP domain-containing protein n=1 Tax=Haloactinopolyspora sp. TaxID=1966353 RepID=UPI0026208D1A|nr:PHP domain-containing protein [Haloactinopolyspora sp.]
MRIDLHTHSNVSDGTDTPAELVHAAERAGLDVVALTDHDTTLGWAEALEAGATCGVEVVPGLEISTELRGRGVHLLAYLVDAAHPGLQAELGRIRSDRWTRLERIAAALTAAGYPLDVDDILAHAQGASSVGRPHVADAMIALGYVADREEAFASYLSEGRAGFASKYAPPTTTAIDLVHAAGGVCVLAHPWGRGSRRVLRPSAIADLRAAGLDGIEVDHQNHDRIARRDLRALAVELDLVVTGASDYHGTGKVGHDLGVNTTDPEQWDRLRSLAAGVPR